MRRLRTPTGLTASCDAQLSLSAGRLGAALLEIRKVFLRYSLLACPARLPTARLATAFKPFYIERAEDELIDAYVRGELSAERRLRFEQHFSTTPSRRARVELAHLLSTLAAAAHCLT